MGSHKEKEYEMHYQKCPNFTIKVPNPPKVGLPMHHFKIDYVSLKNRAMQFVFFLFLLKVITGLYFDVFIN